MIWYRWDVEYGPCFEHVSSKRYMIDPNATNLHRLSYGGVHIKMTMRQALDLYPEHKKMLDDTLDTEKGPDGQIVKVTLYFDKKTEAHVWSGKMLFKGDNLYKRVPLIPFENFIDPRDRVMPLGDNVFAAGLNQEIVDLSNIASNMAKHGGQITLADPNMFDTKTKDALQRGEQQQIIFTDGPRA